VTRRGGFLCASRRRSSSSVPPGFIAAARGGNGQTVQANSVSVTVPGTAAAGQVALFFVTSTSNPTLSSVTSGWTNRSGPDGGGTNVYRGLVFSKTLVSGDVGASVTATLSFAARNGGVILVFEGVTESGLVIANTLDETATSTLTLPTLAAPAGAMLVAAHGRRSSAAMPSITVNAAYTSPVNGDFATAFGSGANAGADVGYVVTAPGGTVGGQSGSSGSNTNGVNYLVALPAA
jgi:hypothetical protein